MPAQEDLWADAELISTYTDAEAVEDGVLVVLGAADRATQAVWEWLSEHLEEDHPPAPFDLFAWYKTTETPRDRAFAVLGSLIGTYEPQARSTYEENCDGGIFRLHACLGDRGQVVRLRTGADVPEESSRTLWLLPNEVGGVTVLFPEDY